MENTQLKNFIDKNQLRIGFVSAPFNIANPDWKAFHWACTMSRENEAGIFNFIYSMGGGLLRIKQPFRFPYFQGVTAKDVQTVKAFLGNLYFDFDRQQFRLHFGKMLHFHQSLCHHVFEAAPPTIESVLETMAMDSYVLDYADFESWASDFGYNPDSIKDRDLFHHCLQQARQFKKFLGLESWVELREIEF